MSLSLVSHFMLSEIFPHTNPWNWYDVASQISVEHGLCLDGI